MRIAPAARVVDQRPYFWNSQSLLSSGQTDLALSHLEMQWKWKACYRRVSCCRHHELPSHAKSTHVADAPSHSTFFACGRGLVGLTFDT